ncbi:MAG TPA: hypothetical protein VHM28_10960 [Anaerolineales bacterium]|jgi:hypothetical protein|nr:hypothetical protein [Anaerolineales bacterium]
MKKHFLLALILLLVPMQTACGSLESPTPIPTPTINSDPCAAENLVASVKKINDLQREFDDASQLAANLPREQLTDAIGNMQRIRRSAEDLPVPACLTTLKAHQLADMNIVINTLIAFVGGADQKSLNDGIARARQEHDAYAIEMARILGVTVAPPVTPTP